MCKKLKSTALNDRYKQGTQIGRQNRNVVYLSILIIYNWGIRTIHRSYNLYLIVSLHFEEKMKRKEHFFITLKYLWPFVRRMQKKLYTKLKSLTLLFFAKKKSFKKSNRNFATNFYLKTHIADCFHSISKFWANQMFEKL